MARQNKNKMISPAPGRVASLPCQCGRGSGESSRLLSLAEACGRAGIAVKTARSWLYRSSISDPDLHAAGKAFAVITRKVGARLKIDEADLNSWIASRRRLARPAPAGALDDLARAPALLAEIADGLFATGEHRRAEAVRAAGTLLELALDIDSGDNHNPAPLAPFRDLPASGDLQGGRI